MTAPRQLHLNYFHHPSGCHEAGWRHASVEARDVLGFEHYVRMAKLCESACFDSIFLGYGYTASGVGHTDMSLLIDPIVALAAVAAQTTHIGLVCTMSTTFNQPYDMAARFAALDHVSHGRAGWNMVTSQTDMEARNFGLEAVPEHDGRYRRAAEFVEVCKKLWDSWEPDARVIDKAAGVYADPRKVHAIHHVGEHYRVEGPAMMPRSPQRWPLLAQAGSSPAGREFAARHADAMFTIASTIEAARPFYAEMKAKVAALGRDPGRFVVMPGLAWVLGATEEEAKRRADELIADFVVPEGGLGLLSTFLKLDVKAHPLDGPVPPLPPLDNFSGGIHRMRILYDYVERERPTVRELAAWFANQMRGHGMFVGTAEQLADHMQLWFETGGCDGYLLLPPIVPRDLDDFCRDVVPILQDRGLFRRSYEGRTLRELYGAEIAGGFNPLTASRSSP
jgi:FMN-dependent oxidoreductase (nitrilotriacetate monooxygenase family)